jgi:hypothetical protein
MFDLKNLGLGRSCTILCWEIYRKLCPSGPVTSSVDLVFSQWLYLGFPIGAVLPFAVYWLHKRYPDKMFDRVIWPIILDGGQTVPQA